MPGNSGPVNILTKQQRIAELARQMPDKAMTSLSYHMDHEWMVEAYLRTRKDGAVLMLLEPRYEQDFLDCSYGFRPGRSAHQALREIQSRLWRMGGGWILDVDLRKFFDNLDHGHLREILAKRMRPSKPIATPVIQTPWNGRK